MNFFDEPYEIPEPDNYTFLYEDDNHGWWLKISTIEELGDYYMKTNQRWGDCLSEYMHHAKEYNENGNYTIFSPLLQAIVMFGERRKMNIFDAINGFKLMAFSQQCEALRNSEYLVFNKVGGYHCGPVNHSQFVTRKTFTWPDFKEHDIRVTQFPGGAHYYVRIGDMELHESNSIKWDTYDEAYAVAKRYIAKEK